MYNLELARLMQRDREREVEQHLRVRAVRRALADASREGFVPPPSGQPARIAHAIRLTPNAGEGG